MTREEQIKAASAAYVRVKCPMAMGGDRFKNMIDSINANPAFIAGAELADANQPNPWISVKARLPRACTVPTIEQYIKNQRYWDNKTAATYLVACGSGKYYDFANYIKNGKKCYWAYNDDIIRNVTHWMPIPELPKEE